MILFIHCFFCLKNSTIEKFQQTVVKVYYILKHSEDLFLLVFFAWCLPKISHVMFVLRLLSFIFQISLDSSVSDLRFLWLNDFLFNPMSFISYNFKFFLVFFSFYFFKIFFFLTFSRKINNCQLTHSWLYRDDGLSVFKNKSEPESKKIKKSIQSIFRENELKITIQWNLKIVDYLDVTFNELNYIHKISSHPPLPPLSSYLYLLKDVQASYLRMKKSSMTLSPHTRKY